MSKQKAKKGITDASVVAEEQPEAYKKVKKETRDSYSKLRDMTDAIKAFSPKP